MKTKRNRVLVGVISSILMLGCLMCLAGISFGSWQLLRTGQFKPLFFASPTHTTTPTHTVSPTSTNTPTNTPIPTSTATPTRPATSTPNLTPGPDCNQASCLQVCIQNLPDIIGFLNAGVPDRAELLDVRFANEPDGAYDLINYAIKKDKIKLTFKPVVPERLKKFQENTDMHKKIWDYFITVIPTLGRDMLTGYTLYTDGSRTRNSAAEAAYDPPYYYLRLDIFDLGSPAFLTTALVHETGHFLTINKNQVSPAEIHFVDEPDLKSYQTTQKKCGYLFFHGSCASQTSYINLFYERFWKDKHDYELYLLYYATYNSSVTDEQYYQIGKILYKNFPDEFLREYSATNIAEDVADSFENFVLGSGPTGKKVADEKSAFFYEFPELVKFREQVIKGVCGYTANH